jgi:protein JSN1
LEEIRSPTSMDTGADDFDVHTLDYLGLDETHHRPPPAATISELRNQAQAVIAGNLSNPPRLRATTVSHPYRRMSSTGNSLLGTPNPEEEEEVYEQSFNSRPALEAYNDSLTDDYFPRGTQGLKQTDYLNANLSSSRPRAISVGTLDDSAARITRRATVSVEQPVYELSSSYNGTNSAQLSQSGILKTDKSTTLRTGSMPSVRFPVTEVSGTRTPSYLLTANQPGRAVSPKSENPTQIQTPTRSLWIGNLDSSVTSEQLIHVFAPYGAIESLRLLPEKVKYRIFIAKDFFSSERRSAVSSTLSIRQTPFALRKMYSTVLAVTSVCLMGRLFASALERRIARPPHRVKALAGLHQTDPHLPLPGRTRLAPP